MGVKSTEANTGKRNLSYSIVNAIRGKNLRALRRPNKGKKYNSNTSKYRSNRTKRLALLNRGCYGPGDTSSINNKTVKARP
jgi:hypothetical protein